MLEIAGGNAPLRSFGAATQQSLIENGTEKQVDHIKPWERGPSGAPAPWLASSRSVRGGSPPDPRAKFGDRHDPREEPKGMFREVPTGPAGDRSGPLPWKQQHLQHMRPRHHENQEEHTGQQQYPDNRMGPPAPWGSQNGLVQGYNSAYQQQQQRQGQQQQYGHHPHQQSQHLHGYSANVYSSYLPTQSAPLCTPLISTVLILPN